MRNKRAQRSDSRGRGGKGKGRGRGGKRTPSHSPKPEESETEMKEKEATQEEEEVVTDAAPIVRVCRRVIVCWPCVNRVCKYVTRLLEIAYPEMVYTDNV